MERSGTLCRRGFQQTAIAARSRLCISLGRLSCTSDAIRTNSPSREKLCDSKGFVKFSQSAHRPHVRGRPDAVALSEPILSPAADSVIHLRRVTHAPDIHMPCSDSCEGGEGAHVRRWERAAGGVRRRALLLQSQARDSGGTRMVKPWFPSTRGVRQRARIQHVE